MNCMRCGKFKTNDSTLCSDCQIAETSMHQMPDPQAVPLTREFHVAPGATDQTFYEHVWQTPMPLWQTPMPPPPFFPEQARRGNSGKVALTITLIVVSLGALGAMAKVVHFLSIASAKSKAPSESKIPVGSIVSSEAKIPERSDASPEAKPSEIVRRTVVLKSSDGKSQITLPEGWQEDRTINKSASLQAGNETKSMFFVVFTDDKKDLRPLTIERYDEMGLKYFLNPQVSRRITNHRKATINGYPALQCEVQTELENRSSIYLHTTVETPRAYYEIVAWTRPSLYESNLPVLQEIIQSFMETGPEK